jgi:ribosomal protein L40E
MEGVMSKYQCMECQEESALPFSGGKCSKCGSLNIRNMEKAQSAQKQEPTTDPKKTFLMVLLWGFIIYLIIKQSS